MSCTRVVYIGPIRVLVSPHPCTYAHFRALMPISVHLRQEHDASTRFHPKWGEHKWMTKSVFCPRVLAFFSVYLCPTRSEHCKIQ